MKTKNLSKSKSKQKGGFKSKNIRKFDRFKGTTEKKTNGNVKTGKTSTWKERASDNENKSTNKGNKKNKWRKTEDENETDFEEVSTKPLHFSQTAQDYEEDGEESSSENECKETRKLVAKQNRKKKKAGGFQAMGLSHNIYKGIIRKGYKIPTPIQRKTIPVILENKDVVAMARTGSGKTAAFLIPMFEKLKTHSAKTGARALILSPTRELAMQTLKFTKELGRFTGLRAAVVLGGDKMEDQFSALHENPDIIIATPGRLLHVLVEMNMKLKAIEYIVFDEADRLFEMGFQEQMHEIINRLPESRQTVLFSATLPKLLVDFAKAGLHDPTLIRLDVETKISENLRLSFFHCREEDKMALALHLLTDVIDRKEQTVIFLATKHHVEYMNLLLHHAGIDSTYIYSSLDQTARKINVAKFQAKKVTVLLVTDLAARGIDIPLLDNVINVNFPAKSKLFVHRVGRVARAGRTGTAYSIVSPEEVPHLIDLHVFLGRKLNMIQLGKSVDATEEDGMYGSVPQGVLDESQENIRKWIGESVDLMNLQKTANNAQKKYVVSRPTAAPESIKRFKSMTDRIPGVHPLFGAKANTSEGARLKLLDALKSYKAHNTIFETNSTSKTKAFDVMKMKRQQHEGVIQRKIDKNIKESYFSDSETEEPQKCYNNNNNNVGEEELREVFTSVIKGKKQSDGVLIDKKKKRKGTLVVKDEENYLSYRPKDYQSELGLSLTSTFDKEANAMSLDIDGDEEMAVKKMKSAVVWDRKRKKFVKENNSDPKRKKILTESGKWIPASYKSNAYHEWLNKTKQQIVGDTSDQEGEDNSPKKSFQTNDSDKFQVMGTKFGKRWHTMGSESRGGSAKKKFKPGKGERRRPEQILKARNLKEKKMAFQKQRQHIKQKRKTMKKKGK